MRIIVVIALVFVEVNDIFHADPQRGSGVDIIIQRFEQVLPDIPRVLKRVADCDIRRIIGSDERCQLLAERVAARCGDIFDLAVVLFAFEHQTLFRAFLVVMDIVITKVLYSPCVSVRSVPGGFDLLRVLVSGGVFVRVSGGRGRCGHHRGITAGHRRALIAGGKACDHSCGEYSGDYFSRSVHRYPS